MHVKDNQIQFGPVNNALSGRWLKLILVKNRYLHYKVTLINDNQRHLPQIFLELQKFEKIEFTSLKVSRKRIVETSNSIRPWLMLFRR